MKSYRENAAFAGAIIGSNIVGLNSDNIVFPVIIILIVLAVVTIDLFKIKNNSLEAIVKRHNKA